MILNATLVSCVQHSDSTILYVMLRSQKCSYHPSPCNTITISLIIFPVLYLVFPWFSHSITGNLFLPLPFTYFAHTHNPIYSYIEYKKTKELGCLSDSVKLLTSARVIISWLLSLSPESGSALTAQSLKPASDSVSSSVCPSAACTLLLALSQK